ncbi:MAG: glutathione S-transferase, partial [Proteobacteria bacterium]|nr:glutathione S-transferase [Pseudomonadota bacterium]
YGDFTLADAFYAPVCTRLLTYGLPMSETAQAYVAAVTGLQAFRDWRDAGLAEDAEVAVYDKAPLTRIPFPLP